MKKILIILGTITLIGTSTTSLVACNHLTQQELEKLKEDNSKIINDIKLEWMAPQEKPFKQLDNKYYFVVWRGDKNDDWRIIKLIHNELKIGKIFDKYNQYTLELRQEIGYPFDFTLYVRYSSSWAPADWESDNGTYFKSVYRWNNNSEPNTPIIDQKTGQITDWNLKKQNTTNNNEEIKVNINNKDISENPIYQLEANYFNWLSITNELETNNIPSLIPAEIKLSDGEYGKYLTNLIVSNDKIENYLNYFSQWYRLLYSKAVWTSMTKDLVEDNIKITFYNHQKLFILNQIELSGIWGYGNYDITIFTEKEKININNLQLFNKNNEKISLIILEI